MSPSKNVGFRRCTFSVPRQVADDLAYVSSLLGVSQSALLSELLSEPVAGMADLLRSTVGEDLGKPEVARRLRGDSINYVQHAVSEFMHRLSDAEGGQA
jgi:hypothetical protein